MLQSAINRLEIIIIIKNLPAISQTAARLSRGDITTPPVVCSWAPHRVASCRMSSAALRQIGLVFTPLWLRQLRPRESCRHLTETNTPRKHNGTKIMRQRLDLIGRAVIPSPTPRLSPMCLKLAPEGIGIRTKRWRSECFLKRRLGVTLGGRDAASADCRERAALQERSFSSRPRLRIALPHCGRRWHLIKGEEHRFHLALAHHPPRRGGATGKKSRKKRRIATASDGGRNKFDLCSNKQFIPTPPAPFCVCGSGGGGGCIPSPSLETRTPPTAPR